MRASRMMKISGLTVRMVSPAAGHLASREWSFHLTLTRAVLLTSYNARRSQQLGSELRRRSGWR